MTGALNPEDAREQASIECELILPCKNEAPALRVLLPRVPEHYAVIVVDNNSTDDTAEVARSLGARVVYEPQPGYGAAVHAGVTAAEHDLIAVMDGDGSLSPYDLDVLLRAVQSGEVDLALGRRRPAADAHWPWHARAGNALIAWGMRRRGSPVHDIGPTRVCRRTDLLDLDLRDRRFGYPFELLVKAQDAGWRIQEYDVGYGPRAEGTRSKVSGTMRGTALVARDLWRVTRPAQRG